MGIFHVPVIAGIHDGYAVFTECREDDRIYNPNRDHHNLKTMGGGHFSCQTC